VLHHPRRYPGRTDWTLVTGSYCPTNNGKSNWQFIRYHRSGNDVDCPALTDKLISVWFSNELPLTKGRRGRSLVCLRRRKLPRSFCREARKLDSGQCPESPTQNNFCRYRQSYRSCKKPLAIVLEPAGRNTAPAAAIAALMLIKTDPNALVLLLPSDHKIADKKAFQKAASIAAQATADNYLVTFGVKPDRPETGYGYIHRGPPLKGHGGVFYSRRVCRKTRLLNCSTIPRDGEL